MQHHPAPLISNKHLACQGIVPFSVSEQVPELGWTMAATRRHRTERNGRFRARMAVPKALQPILGKSELIEPLGGDRRVADRNHAAAAARLQDEIAQAQRSLRPASAHPGPERKLRAITPPDHQSAIRGHCITMQKTTSEKRSTMPTRAAIARNMYGSCRGSRLAKRIPRAARSA